MADSLLCFLGRQAGVHPIRAEIIRDVHDLHVRKSHGMQRLIGRLGVGALVPRTAAAIQHDQLLALQRRDALPQQFQTLGRRARAGVIRTGYVRLSVEILEADVQHNRLFAFRPL